MHVIHLRHFFFKTWCIITHCKYAHDFLCSPHCRAAISLQWRHNGRDSVSNHQPHECLLNCLFRRRFKKNQSSASLAFVRGIHRWPVNSLHKGPVTRKLFPFHDVIMWTTNYTTSFRAHGKTNVSTTTNPTLTSMSFYTLAKWTRYIYINLEQLPFGKHLILDHIFEMRSGLWQCIFCYIWLGYHRQSQKLSLTKKLTQNVCFVIPEYLLLT